MKIMVLGGAGYLGAVLTRQLVTEGHMVKVIDRGYYGLNSLDGVMDKIELRQKDIRETDEKDFEGLDAVINISGLSNDPTANYNPKANEEMNTNATLHVANLAKKAGVKRFVFASTCSVYDFGDSDIKDIQLTEEASVNPKSYYASSKINAEKGLKKISSKDFKVICLRKGTLYGHSPRMRYDLVVNTFFKFGLTTKELTLHNEGKIWRPLIHVKDAADAYSRALVCKLKNNFEVINISADNYRISEVALIVAQVLRKLTKETLVLKMDLDHRVTRDYRVSNKKMKELLKLEPKYSIYLGVKEMFEKSPKDFDNPLYYNITWMKVLEKAKDIIAIGNWKVF